MENLAEKLDEFLDKQVEVQDAGGQGFVIDSMDKAEWAIRKIAKAQQKIKEAEEVAARRVAQIQTWLEAVKKENEEQIQFFEAMLRPFAEKKLEGEKKRSMKLSCGTIGFRKSQPNINHDDNILLPWVKENAPEYIQIKESVAWASLKKTLQIKDGHAVSEDGEIIPGIVAEEVPDKFYVNPEVE